MTNKKVRRLLNDPDCILASHLNIKYPVIIHVIIGVIDSKPPQLISQNSMLRKYENI